MKNNLICKNKCPVVSLAHWTHYLCRGVFIICTDCIITATYPLTPDQYLVVIVRKAGLVSVNITDRRKVIWSRVKNSQPRWVEPYSSI